MRGWSRGGDSRPVRRKKLEARKVRGPKSCTTRETDLVRGVGNSIGGDKVDV